MPLAEIYERVKDTEDFIETVDFLSGDFYEYDWGDELWNSDVARINSFIREHDLLYWDNGASKIVFIYEGYVLKAPITGEVSYTEDEEGNEVECFTEQTDYCETEFNIFKLAESEGVAEFFATTIQIDEHVYMQEAYSTDVESCSIICHFNPMIKEYYDTGYLSDWVDFHTETHDLYELKERLRDSMVFALFVSLYSTEQLRALGNFLGKYDINDLHRSNIGWFGGKIKFIDFSGYCSCTSERAARAMTVM